MHETFEKDGKRFVKYFLINDETNLNIWAVTEESIPIYMKTFIGQPFVEEPARAHFGSENMETHEIVREQEKYRKGTIVEVVYKDSIEEAAAIIEVHDDDLWERMQAGKVLHVSPAIAGFAQIQPDGTKLYKQWFGLHLAHVIKPAYGVLHAGIQKTCEGPEKECIQRLIGIASAQNISFNPLSESPCMGTEQEMKKEDKEMATVLASLTASVSSLQNSVSAMEEERKKEKDMAMEKEKLDKDSAQIANKDIGIPSSIPAGEKQKGTASVASMQAEIATLTAKLAANDDEDKGKMVDEITAMMKDDDMAMEDDMKENMMKNDKASIAKILSSTAAWHARVASTKNSAFASTPSRTIAMASYDPKTADKVTPSDIWSTI